MSDYSGDLGTLSEPIEAKCVDCGRVEVLDVRMALFGEESYLSTDVEEDAVAYHETADGWRCEDCERGRE